MKQMCRRYSQNTALCRASSYPGSFPPKLPPEEQTSNPTQVQVMTVNPWLAVTQRVFEAN